jgi:hypothetical protein
MDAQGTMRLMFDTTDAYDRADFDRLAEIYAEDAQWRNADPNGPHCGNRDDIFAMFRQRRGRRDQDLVRRDALAPDARPADRPDRRLRPVVTVFSFQGRRIVTVKDYPSMAAAEAAIAGSSRPPTERR